MRPILALCLFLTACSPAIHRPPEISWPLPAPTAPSAMPAAKAELPRGYVLYRNFCIECHALANDPYDKGPDRVYRMHLDTRHSSDDDLRRRFDSRADQSATDQDREEFIRFLRSLEKH